MFGGSISVILIWVLLIGYFDKNFVKFVILMNVRFEVFTEVVMKNAVFLDVVV
jgi:hypothetical protein